MKFYILYWFLVMCPLLLIGQQNIPLAIENAIQLSEEQLSNSEEEDLESLHEKWNGRIINLNGNHLEELSALGLVADWQIQQLLLHRKLFGPLIHINELQSIPGWSPQTIISIIPFVTLQGKERIPFLSNKISKGVSQVTLRSTGWSWGRNRSILANSSWLGDSHRMLAQYRWQKNDMQAGFTAEKDPGEPLWQKGKSSGFDFYSAHLFIKKKGLLQTLALGDYTVNLGQGLIQWQSLAFRKSAEITWAKRQGPVFRPHRSAGEYNFHRGVAVQLQKGKWGFWVFLSKRSLSANIITDSLRIPTGISSVNSSGYHRTYSERFDRNNLRQYTSGFKMATSIKGIHLSLNGVGYLFSHPFLPGNRPYQLYRLTGDQWLNLSTDFSFTRKNVHGFGEIAVDKNLAKAMVAGLLVSLDPKLDFSLVLRAMSPHYQSLYSNAFTEGTMPSNENGVFWGICLRPDHRWRMDAYVDWYQFPWLRFQISDAHSNGLDHFLQLSFKPDKSTEMFARYRHEIKSGDEADETPGMLLTSTGKILHKGLRFQFSRKLAPTLTLRARLETTQVCKIEEGSERTADSKGESGFLCFLDLKSKLGFISLPFTFRVQYFDTDGYKSRIYAYEPNLGTGFSIPAFYGRGISLLLASSGNLSPLLSLGTRVCLSNKTGGKGWLPEVRTWIALKLSGAG